MKPRIDPTRQLLGLADLQGGVVTAEQAAGYGLGRNSVARLVSTGTWRRLDPGIYCTRDPDWTSQAWAGVLIGGDSARLGGLAAGYLHGMCDDPPDLILVHIDHEVRRRNRGPWRFRRELQGKQYARPRGAPPRICIEDLVLDLVDTGSDDPRRRGAVHWVATAIQRGLTTPSRLHRALQARERIHDRRLIEDLLVQVAEGPSRRWSCGIATMSSAHMDCRPESGRRPDVPVGLNGPRAASATCTTRTSGWSSNWMARLAMWSGADCVIFAGTMSRHSAGNERCATAGSMSSKSRV